MNVSSISHRTPFLVRPALYWQSIGPASRYRLRPHHRGRNLELFESPTME